MHTKQTGVSSMHIGVLEVYHNSERGGECGLNIQILPTKFKNQKVYIVDLEKLSTILYKKLDFVFNVSEIGVKVMSGIRNAEQTYELQKILHASGEESIILLSITPFEKEYSIADLIAVKEIFFSIDGKVLLHQGEVNGSLLVNLSISTTVGGKNEFVTNCVKALELVKDTLAIVKE